jgi:hypothetical protein
MEDKDSILDEIKAEETEAPYLQRLLTTVIDIAIEVSLIIAFFYFLLPRKFIAELFSINQYMNYVFAFIIIFSYRLVFIFLIGRTVGMILCRTKYLNKNLLPLSPKERFVSVFVTRTSGIKYYKA